MADHDIPYYLDYLPEPLLDELDARGEVVDAVPGLTVAPGLRDEFADIETDEALGFVCELYRRTRADLAEVLAQRGEDRAFLDAAVLEAVDRNASRDYLSESYETPVGDVDSSGRIVLGPAPKGRRIDGEDLKPVDVPDFISGDSQVTLFGPPDTAKMSINAMNALHRQLPDEPPLVGQLVDASGAVPRWGADNEDSKTPIMRSFLRSCDNLVGCFDRSLRLEDDQRGKTYELADDKLSKPIKRIPGLALPDGTHRVDGDPLPLHLFDFAMHLFHNWQHPEALMFYVPKLENEEEAAYLKTLIATAEQMICERHADESRHEYEPGTVKVLVVFENPRAIFRIREMADALAPHFIGGSLGWHDFLASTARVFRCDPRYRIPVKADPNIVINHIKESHEILADALDPLGAISIGGMYGVLYDGASRESYEVSMVGYIKDVIAQLKRGLDGFWVAHPDFVRPGIALVEAFRRRQDDPDDDVLVRLIEQLVPEARQREPLVEFVCGDDVAGLAKDDPLYLRGVLAANVETSDVISNDDPEEVRYNVFQAVQYLADWLSGNGCVALPATVENTAGEDVFVRIMDDLATTERSRWELWAEVAHGRVSVDAFDAIVRQELDFIREDRHTSTRRAQVKWEGRAARWYPIAARLLRELVVNDDPPEFATELLLPFTLDCIRRADDPWQAAARLCPGRYDTPEVYGEAAL